MIKKFSNIGSMRISRVRLALICGQFLEDTIPLHEVEVRADAQNRSGKKRQKAAMNLPLFVAFVHWQLSQFAASGSTPLNGFQHGSTSAVRVAGISR
jgi:hypothetical protein